MVIICHLKQESAHSGTLHQKHSRLEQPEKTKTRSRKQKETRKSGPVLLCCLSLFLGTSELLLSTEHYPVAGASNQLPYHRNTRSLDPVPSTVPPTAHTILLLSAAASAAAAVACHFTTRPYSQPHSSPHHRPSSVRTLHPWLASTFSTGQAKGANLT